METVKIRYACKRWKGEKGAGKFSFCRRFLLVFLSVLEVESHFNSLNRLVYSFTLFFNKYF